MSRTSVGIFIAILLGACADEPTVPDTSSTAFVAAAAAGPVDFFINESASAIEIPPLPGETDVEVWQVKGNTGSNTMLGSSGGRIVLWDDFVPQEILGLDEAAAFARGKIAGTANGHAALWENGQVMDLGTLSGHDRSEATQMRCCDEVVGNSWTGDPAVDGRAFIWTGGAMTELPPLPGDESSSAIDVNNIGWVVGLSREADTGVETIVVWLDGEPVSSGLDLATHEPIGINDFGALISSRAGDGVVYFRAYQQETVPLLPPHDSGRYWAVAMSPVGAILGKVETSDPLVPYRYGRWLRDAQFAAINVSPISECTAISDGEQVTCSSPQRDYPLYIHTGGDGRLDAGAVVDLTGTSGGESTVTLEWTQVDDGAGGPASYRVKYARPPIDWRTATVGCDVQGDQVGSQRSCVVAGLENGAYDFQLMSFRWDDSVWAPGALYSNVGLGRTTPGAPDPPSPGVHDLRVTKSTGSTLTVAWTEVDDGTGAPAWYRVKYSAPPIDWKTAAIGCDRTMKGIEIGSEMSCTIEGLDSGTKYDVLMMSFRNEDGVWTDARYSNPGAGTTEAPM